MAIMDRRGDNRRGRFGSASEKSYYEMKKAAEERANRKKAKAKPKSKSNAELKKIADRDNKRGLTKKQARDIDLTGTRKRGSGAKAKAKAKTTTPKTTTPKTTTPKRKAGVGTIDGPRKTKTENKSILKQPQRMSTTPKTTTPKRKAGVGTIDGPRKTTTSKKKTSSFKEKVIQKANALKQRVIDRGKALNSFDTRQIMTGGPRNRPGVTKLFDDGPSNKKDSFFPNSRSSRNREEGYNPDPFAKEYRKDGGEIKAYKKGGKVSSRGNGCAVRGIK
tara:strand:+ start:137 stop:964 length:828 start_codon:yes stop_codon:yes gene_type:complete